MVKLVIAGMIAATIFPGGIAVAAPAPPPLPKGGGAVTQCASGTSLYRAIDPVTEENTLICVENGAQAAGGYEGTATEY
jgi:hypothetical protein